MECSRWDSTQLRREEKRKREGQKSEKPWKNLKICKTNVCTLWYAFGWHYANPYCRSGSNRWPQWSGGSKSPAAKSGIAISPRGSDSDSEFDHFVYKPLLVRLLLVTGGSISPHGMIRMGSQLVTSRVAQNDSNEVNERWRAKDLLLVKKKEKKLLKIQSLPKVLRSQAMRSTT
jgi:hypothetical protein